MADFEMLLDGGRDIDELRRRIRNADVKHEAAKAMRQSLLDIQAEAGDYPPAPANSSYVRTGTLGRKWTTKVEVRRNNVRGVISSDAVNDQGQYYGQWVKGPEKQRPLFERIGWQTLLEDFQQQRDKIIGHFADALRRVNRELGD